MSKPICCMQLVDLEDVSIFESLVNSQIENQCKYELNVDGLRSQHRRIPARHFEPVWNYLKIHFVYPSIDEGYPCFVELIKEN